MIKLFRGVLVMSLEIFEFSVVRGAFVIGVSQSSPIFSKMFVYRFSKLGVTVGPLSIHAVLFYAMSDVCPFHYTAVAGSGKVGSLRQIYYTSWVTVVNQTDSHMPSRFAVVVLSDFKVSLLCCRFAFVSTANHSGT